MACQSHSTALAKGRGVRTHETIVLQLTNTSFSRRIDPSGLGSRSSPRDSSTGRLATIRNNISQSGSAIAVLGSVRFKSINLCSRAEHLLSELQLAAG